MSRGWASAVGGRPGGRSGRLKRRKSMRWQHTEEEEGEQSRRPPPYRRLNMEVGFITDC